MAATIIEFDFSPGATPTLTLFLNQSDTIQNGAGDVGAEETNRGGTYLATVDEALVGWYKAYATIGTTTMPIGWVNIVADDTNTYEVDRIGLPATTSVSGDIAAVPVNVLAAGDIDGFSLEDASKIILSSAAAKLSGAPVGPIIIRAADDSKDRITATVDGVGNRTTVVLDGAG